jgi:nicotinate-nucleotide pyrophosphorylase (carboxylating)
MPEVKSKRQTVDVPQVLFGGLIQQVVRAEIVPTEAGVVVGAEELAQQARLLGLRVHVYVASGSKVLAGKRVALVTGNPVQVVRGEDILLGIISKVSGVATAAREAVKKAGTVKVVCGGWKKMPLELKQELRMAIKMGGAYTRICAEPFVYLDKNYVRIFGSVPKAIDRARLLPGRAIVIQLRGDTAPIEEEAVIAAGLSSQVIMVDTGNIDDLRSVSKALHQSGLRKQVQLAFAGGINLDDLENLCNEDLDVVDIGRAILDAPLLDFRYNIVRMDIKNDGVKAL